MTAPIFIELRSRIFEARAEGQNYHQLAGRIINTVFASLLASGQLQGIKRWAYLRDLLPSWPNSRPFATIATTASITHPGSTNPSFGSSSS